MEDWFEAGRYEEDDALLDVCCHDDCLEVVLEPWIAPSTSFSSSSKFILVPIAVRKNQSGV